MKLRNKKTGEIIDLDEWSFDTYNDMFYIARGDAEGDNIEYFKSFADFNSKYEDYEEPKESWYMKEYRYINTLGQAQRTVMQSDDDKVFADEVMSIGNYFETEEEVQKAVEKIKAWKRLKDKGFKFYGWNKGSLLKNMPNNITFACDDTRRWAWKDIQDDLDLLFGGEE